MLTRRLRTRVHAARRLRKAAYLTNRAVAFTGDYGFVKRAGIPPNIYNEATELSSRLYRLADNVEDQVPCR